MKILVIDNYDSFTYNLVQLIGKFEDQIIVRRNDKISISEIVELSPDKILISPGPGHPKDSNISLETIKQLGDKYSILGVCLGHQAIGVAYGAYVKKAPYLMHGKVSTIKHFNKGIFKNITQNFSATRYHSLIIDKNNLPAELEITAESSDGLIMGIKHRKYDVQGIQFHPESFLTSEGENLIKNWLVNN